MRGAALVFGATLTLQCAPSRGAVRPPSPRAAPPTTSPGRVTSRAPARPQLLVSIVYDQLPSWALERYRPLVAPDGALAQALARGSVHPVVRFDYANTATAPGHAAIYTGAVPAESGIYSNDYWSSEARRRVPAVDDPDAPVYGGSGYGLSPRSLRVEGVADVLREATSGAARVVSLSIKDRSAILPGGKQPTLVAWYDPSLPGFTTSRYYASRLPPLLERFRREHPVSNYVRAWEALDASRWARLLGPDDAPGEGNWFGLGDSFPHHPEQSPEPNQAFLATPTSAEYLLDLARLAVQELELGEDEVPDLLALSLSNTDTVGHVFGAESWEYVDNLIRSDRAVGQFLQWLEQRTRLAVVITSDHGVARRPETTWHETTPPPVRLRASALLSQLEDALDRELGQGHWVEAVVAPLVYLHPELTGDQRSRAAAVAAAELTRLPGVSQAVVVRQASEVSPLVRANLGDQIPGDVYFVPREYSVIDPEMPGGSGTNHGTPWAYDREVPVVFWGPGVRAGTYAEPSSQRRVASTLAALVGVRPPQHANPVPLDGAPRLGPSSNATP